MSDTAKQLAKVDYYIKLVLKKRWFMIIPFCIAMIAGIYLSVTLPKVYQASNLILVVPKSVPDSYVSSPMERDVQDRINTIQEQIMSRTNLERIIKEFNLLNDKGHQHMFFEDKIRAIRRSASVKVKKGRGGIESFTISFKGQQPEKVMKVVNSLGNTFIDESINVMQDEVMGTNKFLEDELNSLRKRLEAIENSIKDYRWQHIGELPEELSSNLATLTRLQEQLNEKQQSIRDAKNRLVLMENQLAIAKLNASAMPGTPVTGSGLRATDEKPVSELEKLHSLLKEFQGRYTKNHPDMIRLKEKISLLEEKEAEETAPDPENEDTASLEVLSEESMESQYKTPEQLVFDLSRMELMAQRHEIEQEIAVYSEDIVRIEEQAAAYQKRVENTSKREQDLLEMKRNYANLQRTYQRLLDRKLESDIAVNMEKKQKGQKFRVIDSAKLPRKPISPDMKKILALCIVAGLGIGGGLIFLLDFIDSSVKIPDEIEPELGVPMLATIPEIYSRKDEMMYKINQAMSLCFTMLAFVLFSVFVLFSLKGVDRTLAYVKKFI